MEYLWLQENETFIDDGIAIEPFNLNKEREEGYFDASGNYVEYLNENEIKVLVLHQTFSTPGPIPCIFS